MKPPGAADAEESGNTAPGVCTQVTQQQQQLLN